MKKLKRLMCLLLSASFLFSCAAQPTETSETTETTETAETETETETAEASDEQTTEADTEVYYDDSDDDDDDDDDDDEVDAAEETETAAVAAEDVLTEEGYMTATGERVAEEVVDSYPRLTNLPTLYINLTSRKGQKLGISSVEHDVYSEATYTYVDPDVTKSYYDLPMQIKGRGNYSWSFDQKPYTIKLAEKANLCGMGKAKKWVLVTVHDDKTMMHNYITQKFGKYIGLDTSCDNEYIDVVCNGEYIGTYVLTEKIEIAKHRVDIGDEGTALFEIEMVYRHTCDLCAVMYENTSDPSTSIHLKVMEFHGVKVDDMTDEQRAECQEWIDEYFANMKVAMRSDDWDTLMTMVDIDSYVNWYLLNEINRNYDSAFVTSDYCYITKDGKCHMGPNWDFDTCYGIQFSETEGSRLQTVAAWYRWLFEYCPEWYDLVEQRYTELRDNGVEQWYSDTIDSTAVLIAESEKLEHELYPHCEMADMTWTASMKFMKRWLKLRFKWMDSQFYVGTNEDYLANK